MKTNNYWTKFFLAVILVFGASIASAVIAKHFWDVVIDNNLTVGGVTPTATEWGYVDVNDQTVRTTDSPTFQGFNMGEVATPATPSTNENKIYFKADNNLYRLDDAGIEKKVGSGGGGSAGVDLLAELNGNCEDGDPPIEWVNVGAAFSAETVNQGFDAQSCAWDPSAASQTLTTATVTIPDGLQGQNCAAEFWTKWSGTAGDVKVKVEDGSDVIIRGPEDLASSTEWQKGSLSFLCPASGDMRLEFVSLADSSELLVDNVKLGSNELVLVPVQDVFSARITISGAVGTVSDENQNFIDGNCTFASGNVTCNWVPGVFSTRPNTTCLVANQSGSNLSGCEDNGTSDTILQLKSEFVGASTFGNHTVATFDVIVQKTGADAPVYAVKADQTNRPWTAYTPVLTGFGTASGVSAYWKRQGEDMIIRLQFTSGTSTATEARVSLPGSYTTKSTVDTLEVAGSGAYDTLGNFVPYLLIEPSVAYMTFGLASSSHAGFVKKDGNVMAASGSSLSFTARVPIEGWIETNDAPLIKNSVVSSSEGIERIERVSFAGASETGNCTSSPCTMYRNTPGVDSVTRSATGTYSINFVSGTFSDAPTCVAHGRISGTGSGVSYQNGTPTASAYPLLSRNNADATADGSYNVICMGPN